MPIIGGTFDAVVPGVVLVDAIAVALVVGLVVLVVVGNEVLQREAVVRGDEVDAGQRAAPVIAEQVAAAGQPVGQVVGVALVAAPEAAHRVAVLAIPLMPEQREIADLITALADVPELGDQLDLRDDRILMN